MAQSKLTSVKSSAEHGNSASHDTTDLPTTADAALTFQVDLTGFLNSGVKYAISPIQLDQYDAPSTLTHG